MPLPLPILDDRRFDDLFQEARDRVQAYTPEWTQINPGDPGVALIDLFAWLAETILYRQNLIPLRQRRAFLNLLRIPLRPAAPARGVVCIDASPSVAALPAPILVGQGVLTPAKGTPAFTTATELQPTWLGVLPMVKAVYDEPDPIARQHVLAMLQSLYALDTPLQAPLPFVAQQALQSGPLRLNQTIDGTLYLALVKPAKLPDDVGALRSRLAGLTLSIGLAPPDEVATSYVTDPPPRRLTWSVATTLNGHLTYLPLEMLVDTSNGARRAGVAQLRLPADATLLAPPVSADPMFAGYGASPPELPAGTPPDSLVGWLRLQSPDDPNLALAWLGINAVAVTAQTMVHDALLGIGDGQSDQAFGLSGAPVDPTSLKIEVWPAAQPGAGGQAPPPATWNQVDNFGAAERDDQVYTLDPSAGVVQFGDGIRGARVPAGAAVYARTYAYGGGADGNLAAGSIKQLANANGMLVRHEWPTAGGVEAETVVAAERRIPAYLANRERAVTTEDFAWLAQNVPGAEVARADVVAGLMPGIDPAASRSGVAGVVSVFVIPPGERKLAGVPRPNLALLRLVFDYLRQRTLIGTQLFALAPDYVQIGVWTAVRLTDESNRTEVLAAVRQALIDYLWPLEPGGPLGAGWPMGRAVAPDELLTRSGRVPGVLAADGASIFRRDPSGWTAIGGTLSLQPYQLPDLIGVTVAVSTDPDGGTASPPWSDAPPGGAGQPVPFIPKKC